MIDGQQRLMSVVYFFDGYFGESDSNGRHKIFRLTGLNEKSPYNNKTYKELEPMRKKAILFIMTDDTKNCDEVQEYLERNYSDLNGKVLTIHTNRSGDISETVTGKAKEELNRLRKQANEIDSLESPYKVIVSVLMLKEGWDVQNVTTIVGLRAYTATSNILPEQTLGRGLRRMFFGREDVEEYVSVIGTPAFMDFVESIKAEGVEYLKAVPTRSEIR